LILKFLNKLIPLCLLLGLSACLGTKHLQENELLLVENNIKGNEQISSDNLDDFYRQEPNLQVPLIPWAPYVSIYYLGENFHNPEKIRRKREEEAETFDERIAKAEARGRDTRAERLRQKKRDQIDKRNRQLEEGNFLMRFGEPIVVFDSTLAQRSAQQMEQYLHSKGFFHAETDFEYETEDRKVSVTYLIEENNPFMIDSLYLTVADENIRSIIRENQEETYLDTLDRYDEEKMSKERTRIDNLLKNNGYYEFSPQYIEFNVDTTLGNHRVAIETRIFRPANRGYHRQFRVDSVIFTTDATIRGDLAGRLSRTYNGISYRFFEEQYSKRVLDSRVFIRPDSLYSRQNTLETQKQLANLDIFKFINIHYDTTGGQFNAQIFTSPLKRFQTSNEVGFTYSQGIPGPYFNSTWTNRNTFGGLEILQLNLRAGIEGVPSTVDPTQAFGSNQAGANLSLIFPQFIAPLNSQTRTRLGELNPKTRLSLGGAFTDRVREFRRTNLNSSLTYTWQTERRRRDNVYNVLYNFTPIDVSVIDSEIYTGKEEGELFNRLLKEWENQGNPYIRSFDPSFVSSIYGFAVFTTNNYGTYTDRSRYIRPFVESGGTTQNLIDFPLTEEGDTLRGNLRSFRFLRFSNDYREFYPLGDNSAFAFRINAGLGIPYGDTRTLPYEKFFFAGGSNSIRAFRPRRLGPGVYTPQANLDKNGDPIQSDENAIVTNLIEQPGEILLEGSLEYRHNIFGFLNGAVFLDFGNIWRIRKSEAFPGGEFRIDEFYKQIALGSGYGLRLDFSFLIVRFDFGLKIYNPQNVTRGADGNWDYSQGWMFDKMKYPITDDLIIFNLGIGYPF
jgi:outer membrane protein insertion porin family